MHGILAHICVILRVYNTWKICSKLTVFHSCIYPSSSRSACHWHLAQDGKTARPSCPFSCACRFCCFRVFFLGLQLFIRFNYIGVYIYVYIWIIMNVYMHIYICVLVHCYIFHTWLGIDILLPKTGMRPLQLCHEKWPQNASQFRWVIHYDFPR